jgi:hypothetical protein
MLFDIAARIEAWRMQLLDTSKRNRLINFKAGRTGGIALIHPDPGDLWHRLVTQDAALTFQWKRDLIDLPPDPEAVSRGDGIMLFDPSAVPQNVASQDILERCRRSPRLRADHLLTDFDDRRLAARLTRMALNARESLTEQGVAILYVAFGFLRWFEAPDGQVEVRSPLLLVPVRLERDHVEAPWRLQVEDEEILSNHSLKQLLSNNFRLELPAPEEAANPDEPTWRTHYFGEVERCIRHVPRWEVLDEVALGTFSFQKLAMWEDLGRNRGRIAAHDLCRAIAGDPVGVLRGSADLPGGAELDQSAHPKQTFHILDADSSQHEAIAAATRGTSLVLDGPPGTGKSQTIANIIAEFLAAGKTVLFVSEKAAALEVVQRRLQDRGLGDFCLACHSQKANKRDVVVELGRCLSLEPAGLCDLGDDLERLFETRRQLNEYVRQLHAPRPPLAMTAYQVHGELARLNRAAGSSRCPVSDVLSRDGAYLRRVSEVLARLPDCRGVIEYRDRHPWRGCRAVDSQTLREDVRHHFGRLAECIRQIQGVAETLYRTGFSATNPTRTQWLNSLDAARAVLACPQVPPSWFGGDPRSVAEAVVRLDQLTQAYRRTFAALPEFSPEALQRIGAASLAAWTTPSDGRPRLIPPMGDTVRTLAQRLAGVSTSLRELQRQAAVVDHSAGRVTELLQVSFSVPVKGRAAWRTLPNTSPR